MREYLGVDLTREEFSLKEKEANRKFSLLHYSRNMKQMDSLKKKIRKVLNKYHVQKAGIFGSYALGEGKRGSDIDILIEAPKGIGFGFVRIQFELQDALKKKVDLVSYDSIHPKLRERILREEVRIL